MTQVISQYRKSNYFIRVLRFHDGLYFAKLYDYYERKFQEPVYQTRFYSAETDARQAANRATSKGV